MLVGREIRNPPSKYIYFCPPTSWIASLKNTKKDDYSFILRLLVVFAFQKKKFYYSRNFVQFWWPFLFVLYHKDTQWKLCSLFCDQGMRNRLAHKNENVYIFFFEKGKERRSGLFFICRNCKRFIVKVPSLFFRCSPKVEPMSNKVYLYYKSLHKSCLLFQVRRKERK